MLLTFDFESSLMAWDFTNYLIQEFLDLLDDSRTTEYLPVVAQEGRSVHVDCPESIDGAFEICWHAFDAGWKSGYRAGVMSPSIEIN